MSTLRILLSAALIGVCSGQTSDCSYLSLLKYLSLTPTNDLLTVMRPVRNWTTPTIVLMDMYLYGILSVDEKSQTVTSHIWATMGWQNEFLSWNPSDFCGTDELAIPTSRLWIPDINIQEDASDSGSTQRGSLASVHCSGLVIVSARQRLTSTCQLKLRQFPFDIQLCNITFASMTSDGRSIKLGTFTNDTVLTKLSEEFMVTHGEWQLKDMEALDYDFTKGGIIQSKLVYRVKLVRKPMLYVVNFIVPLFYLLVLDLASFFISADRGEKMSFKITILLSISVLLLMLQDMLPSTEDQLPMIANYCVGIFTMVWVSVLEAMLVYFLADPDGYCDNKTQKSVDAEEEIQMEADCHEEPPGQIKPGKCCLPLDGPTGVDLLKRLLEEVKAARQGIKGQEADKTKSGFYRKVAEIIDYVFFTLYLLTVVVFLTYMYQTWAKDFFS